MRFEHKLESGLTFYYELGGKQENNLFVVRFSMGRVEDETTDFQFHSEVKSRDTFKEMQDLIELEKKYCLDRGFNKVKSTKRDVIT